MTESDKVATPVTASGNSDTTQRRKTERKEDELGPQKLGILVNVLWDMRALWYNIGDNLRLKDSDLQAIRLQEREDPGSCLRAVLSKWLHQASTPDRPISWSVLLFALKQNNVASMSPPVIRVIEEKYLKKIDAPVNQNGNGQLQSTQSTATTNGATNQIEPPGPVNQTSNNQAAHRTATTNEATNQEQPRFNNDDKRKMQEKSNGIRVVSEAPESFMSEVVVLIQTVKQEEQLAVYEHMKPPTAEMKAPITWICEHPKIALTLGMFGDHKTAVIKTKKGGNCQSEVTYALNKLRNVKLIIVVGFAYGKKVKCSLGDVIVSTTVDGVTELRCESNAIHIGEGTVRYTEMKLAARTTFATQNWMKFNCLETGERFSEVHTGVILSAPVLLNDSKVLQDFLKNNSRFIGGEMEGQQLALCTHQFLEENKREVDFIVIKGVADFGDGTKKGNWQLTASLAAAKYAEESLRKTNGQTYKIQAKPIPRELPDSDQSVNETEDKEEDDVERDEVHGELPHEETPDAVPSPKPIPRELPHSDQSVNETEDKEEDDVERDKVHGELPHEEAPDAAPKPKPIPRELPHSDQFVNETEDKEEDDVERDKVHGELPHEEAPEILAEDAEDKDKLVIKGEDKCGDEVERDSKDQVPPDTHTAIMDTNNMVHLGVMEYTYDELEESIKPENLIGEGGFGQVYKGSARSTSIAVKVLFECGKSSMKEINCLAKYRQENILSLMGYCKHQIENPNDPEQVQHELILVLPYVKNGSLHKLLHFAEDPIPWDTRVTILTDTARGLAYLHSSVPPLVHQDIKSSNILISEHGQAKVCDFGFSINLPEGNSNNTVVTCTKDLQLAVSLGYSPPELVEGYSCSGDVYSYGIVVLETYTRVLPYSKERDDRRIAAMFEDQLSDQAEFTEIADKSNGNVPPKTIETFYTIVKGCLKSSEKRRLTINKVLQQWDKFVNGNNC